MSRLVHSVYNFNFVYLLSTIDIENTIMQCRQYYYIIKERYFSMIQSLSILTPLYTGTSRFNFGHVRLLIIVIILNDVFSMLSFKLRLFNVAFLCLTIYFIY